jgi:lipoprotein-releasing system permease protein
LNFPYYIAKRYLFAKSGNNAINIITKIASVGVIVGTAALFIILSGFSGLRTFSDSLLEISDPDIKITPTKGKSFVYSDSLHNILNNNSNIVDFSKVTEERVFLKNDEKQQIAYIKGVDYNYINVVKLDSAIHVGNWLEKDYQNTGVIGNGLAYKLSLGVMSFSKSLEIYVPKPGTGFLNPTSSFRKINTQIIGVYYGTEEFENKFVFVSNPEAQRLLGYEENQFTGVEIRLKEGVDADDFSVYLQKEIGNTFKVETKAQLNSLFYKVINTENFVSYLIFTLIVIIAMFNVIGAIIMMIIDKKKNLKTILNLGATLKEIKKIFIIQGFLLTMIGMSIGLGVAILVVFIQQQFELFMITENIAYPVELRLSNILIVFTTITILGFITSKIASSRISMSFIEK